MTNSIEGAMPPLPEPSIFQPPWSLICKWSDMEPGPGAGFVADQIDEALRVYATDYAKAYAAPLLARVAELQAQNERLKMEAQIHAQEARTANATIAEIYQCVTGKTGEPGNWNGAEPVRARLAELEADAARWRELRSSHEESDSGESICVFEPDHGAHCLKPIGSMPGELDTAIDAALAAKEQQP